MRRRQITFFISLFFTAISAVAQTDYDVAKDSLSAYFREYYNPSLKIQGEYKLQSLTVDDEQQSVIVVGNEVFAGQPFTPTLTEKIYEEVRAKLPETYKRYKLTVFGGNYSINDLIPNFLAEQKNEARMWQNINYKGVPWVDNVSKPVAVTRGLQNRHLTIWASHGRYYKNAEDDWRWQRPYLFCTTEDLLTQTFVVPYLIPMLENAGAIVFTPRERDWQKHEVVVDNDTPHSQGTYVEKNGKFAWADAQTSGFLQADTLYDGDNPFVRGTARMVEATSNEKNSSLITWMPQIPADGQYAVYVSYPAAKNGVSDAHYKVRYKGNITDFLVNQQMGGGTWVYLGTFDFDAGQSEYNSVMLSNESGEDGMVLADAVRFGGGMGNIMRGDTVLRTSGMARFLEGARYTAQWGGMPYSVYSGRSGTNDYADDINVRSYMANHLGGGSVYMPDTLTLNVPLELSVALHSDAGYKPDDLVGSLSVCTTNFYDGKLAAGVSRLASRDLCDLLLTTVSHDLTQTYGQWTRRQIYDRNYSETRLPKVPSAILEMFSHQNFNDMRYAHDPNFKFTFSRAVYKAILKYVCEMHEREYVVQPLPVGDFSLALNEKKNTVTLNWLPAFDPLEQTATPQGYVVYTREGAGSFDNGTYVKNKTTFTRHIDPDKIYSFRVTAVNKGGESFPSETLAAMKSSHNSGTVLIVNGFHRLSGPQIINNDSTKGFDLNADVGVPYLKTPEYCGAQQCFDASQGGKEDFGALGYSGNEMEGMLVAGNTFDYPYLHGRAIQAAGGHSFVSCSSTCVQKGLVQINGYPVADLILGAEKDDGYSVMQYKSFPSALQSALANYCRQGGNLLVSGSYVASDMNGTEDSTFTANVLKYTNGGSFVTDSVTTSKGMDMEVELYRHPNEVNYAVQRPDCLQPVSPAYAIMTYPTTENPVSAVAYEGTDYRTIVLGFPFEGIVDETARTQLMGAFLNFLQRNK